MKKHKCKDCEEEYKEFIKEFRKLIKKVGFKDTGFLGHLCSVHHLKLKSGHRVNLKVGLD